MRLRLTCCRQDIVDEDKQCLLVLKLDSLANHIDKLPHCQVSRDQILLLVYGWQIALAKLLNNNLLPKFFITRPLLCVFLQGCGAGVCF